MHQNTGMQKNQNVWEVFSEFLNKQDENFDFHCTNPNDCLDIIKKNLKCKKAAGGVVINSVGELLMIERFGKYDLPKGHIEKGETPIETAFREVFEETGIMPDASEKELPPSYHIYFLEEKPILKEVYWFLMSYTGNVKPIPQTKEQISSAGWYSKEKMKIVEKNIFYNLKPYLEYFLIASETHINKGL